MSDFTAIRKLARSQANDAPAWVALDELLGKVGELNRLISDRQAEAEKIARDNAAAKEGMMEAETDAANIVWRAGEEAKKIAAEAEAVKQAASDELAAANDALAAAVVEAKRLVEQGRSEASKAAIDADGRLGALRKDIAAAEGELLVRNDQIVVADGRLAELKAEIARVKAMFG